MSWILKDGHANLGLGDWFVSASLGGKRPKLEIQTKLGYSNKQILTMDVGPIDSNHENQLPWLPFGDAYVRQNDLIAIYPEKYPWQFGYQIDIRTSQPDDRKILCMEIWLSVQTSLLDSHPQLSIQIADENFAPLSKDIWTNLSKKVAIAIHPFDRADCHVECTTNDFNMKIFGRFMEKGVIRRMRFRCIAAIDSQSNNFWEEQLKEFSNSPMPLTT